MSRDPTAFRAARARSVRPLHERLAKIHDEEIAPLWDTRLAALLRAGLFERGDSEPITGAVLEIGCGEGQLTAELAEKHDGGGEARLVAIGASGEQLERARVALAGHAETGVRVFLRQHETGTKLPFAEETFDLVLAHDGFSPPAGIEAGLRELCRLTVPGGRVMAVLPLAGTWGEVLDLLDEVLVGLGASEARWALDAHRADEMDGAMVIEAAEAAGLVDVQLETARWELLFRSGRELLYAPIVESGPLPAWKAAAGRGTDMNEVFVALDRAIDTYSGGAAFATSVVAARLTGRKPAQDKPAAPKPAEAPRS